MPSNPQPLDLSDHDCVLKCQSGDSKSFDLLVLRHQGKIYALIRNMVRNDSEAWDLTQDTFLKAWKALPRFEARSEFSTWLYRIAHNVVYDRKRKFVPEIDGEWNDQTMSQASAISGAPTVPTESLAPDQAMERRELQESIRRALQELSEDHREVIILKDIQGLSYQEIADCVGCSLGTVMSRIFYARKKLQQLLQP